MTSSKCSLLISVLVSTLHKLKTFSVLLRRDTGEVTANPAPGSQWVCGFLAAHWELGVPSYHCPRTQHTGHLGQACLVCPEFPPWSQGMFLPHFMKVCRYYERGHLDKASIDCRRVQLPPSRQAAANPPCG